MLSVLNQSTPKHKSCVYIHPKFNKERKSLKKMDAFSSFFESQSASRNSLMSLRPISPTVQTHLKQVYLSLCCALIASAAGAYLHILWNIGGLLTTFGCLGGIVWLLLTPPSEEKTRVSLLMAAALFEGASIGPLIKLAIEFDPSILVSDFVGRAVALGCFSMAATLARHREYLYLGGLLSSGLGILFWLHFASCVFGETAPPFKLESYFGHLVFVAYIVVDTQDIIEKAELGDLDYVKHALTLFTDFVVRHALSLFSDFVAVFVRILIIMLKKREE